MSYKEPHSKELILCNIFSIFNYLYGRGIIAMNEDLYRREIINGIHQMEELLKEWAVTSPELPGHRWACWSIKSKEGILLIFLIAVKTSVMIHDVQ